MQDVRVERDVSMASLTTFRAGGHAAYAVYPSTPEAWGAIIAAAKKENIPFAVLGNGSNVLATDEDFAGILIITTDMRDVRVEETCVYAQAGASLSAVAVTAMKAGLAGLEFSYGIPGTVGGAIFMNAGAYDGEMQFAVKQSRYLDEDGQVRVLEKEEHAFGYRDSYYQHHFGMIIDCILQLKPGNPEEIKAKMDDFMCRRKSKQPLMHPSAGNTFRRPYKGYASQMVDECALKGFRVGGAAVSEMHAGFIINDREGSVADIVAVIQSVQKKVFAEKGVMLEREVRMLHEIILNGIFNKNIP